MIRYQGVIHNGQMLERLPLATAYAQIPLRGETMVKFGAKPMRFGPSSFRLFASWKEIEPVDSAICLTFALPRSTDLEATGAEPANAVRFAVDTAMSDILHAFKTRAAQSLPIPIHMPDSGLAAATAACVRDLSARIDELPGRSRFKRVDTFHRLERARDFLEQNYLQDPTTEDLALEAAISRAHFIRLYGAFYGVSPKQQILELKVREAQQLLEATAMSIWEVAEAAGFGNRCAFQRMFRQRVGQTPGEYRQQFSYRRATRSVYARSEDRPRESVRT